jgi:hypothetical protein
MKQLVIIFLFFIGISIGCQHCESKRDPYEIGSHWDYSIECENGFIYKIKNRAVMQVFNSDGTLLRCGKKIF